jgi:hypothetical protein
LVIASSSQSHYLSNRKEKSPYQQFSSGQPNGWPDYRYRSGSFGIAVESARDTGSPLEPALEGFHRERGRHFIGLTLETGKLPVSRKP